MGIKGLTQLLADVAPGCLKEQALTNYFGRKIAIDASTAVYQFLIAIRMGAEGQLANEAGDTTSHLQGMFHRTIRMLELGVKPVYVFDGKAPDLKRGELDKRSAKAKEAAAELEKAEETGNAEDIEKFAKRTVRATTKQMDECRKLLKLMGVPFVNAPTEAEAQCAALCKANLVYATASEDMDTMTFASPILLRNFTVSEQKKVPVKEFHVKEVLDAIGMTQDEFIDLCILCGCDYMDTIKGIGPKTAYQLIKKHHTLEEVVKNLDSKKYSVPEDFLEMVEKVRVLFRTPDVITSGIELKWEEPDLEGLIEFLVKEHSFSTDRVEKGVQRIKATRGKATQQRLDAFFGPATVIKRKAPEPAKNAKKPKISLKDPKKGKK